MKAISRLFIVGLLFVATTGFGLTTTDLSQNSDHEIVICDYADIVSFEVVYFRVDLNAQQSYETVSENASFKKEKFKNLIDLPIKSEYDVGWLNLNDFLNMLNNRSPRDNLTYYSE
ncbi:hypothetical protein [Winogradskyella forsetii]|uniref:hypothetical protein n=1 Tax=Winogradskyella forsetii TaxID=2686077 RepID=UPI0015BBF2E1|nr:hypothetical protein [Winogradskyella forsetii]